MKKILITAILHSIFPFIFVFGVEENKNTFNNAECSSSLMMSTDVQWGNVSNVDINYATDTYVKTIPGGAWDAGMGSSDQLPAGEDGFVESTILDKNEGSAYFIGLSQTDQDYQYSTIEYGIFCYNLTGFIFENGVYQMNIGSFQVGDTYKIERIGSLIFYYKNNLLLDVSTTPSINVPLVVDASIFDSGIDGIKVDVKVSFGSSSGEGNQYVKLMKKLDGGYLEPSNAALHFKYIQDYAIVASQNDEITCTIFDWKRMPVFTDKLSNIYGVNWQELSLPSTGMTATEFYVLEVEGANKGEKYYLRFKPPCLPAFGCSPN